MMTTKKKTHFLSDQMSFYAFENLPVWEGARPRQMRLRAMNEFVGEESLLLKLRRRQEEKQLQKMVN